MRQKITNWSESTKLNLFARVWLRINASGANDGRSLNRSIEMKSSRPPGGGQETQRPHQVVYPACFWGRNRHLTQGWGFGKPTLTFVVGDSGSSPSPTHALRGSSLSAWPFWWPLNIVHVSHIWVKRSAATSKPDYSPISTRCSWLLLVVFHKSKIHVHTKSSGFQGFLFPNVWRLLICPACENIFISDRWVFILMTLKD